MSNTLAPRVCSLAALAAVLCWAPVVVQAQDAPTSITVGGRAISVERDGDFVRVRTPGQEVEASGDWRNRQVTLTRGADTESLLNELGANRSEDAIRVAVSGDVLFDFDSAEIRSDARDTLAQIAQVIRAESRGDVYVVGHTDSVGTDAYNQRLSEQRAAAVIGWLSVNEGIPASIMVGRGMGPNQPVAENTRADGSDNPEGRAANRRVELLLATRDNVDLRARVESGRVDLPATGVSVQSSAAGQTVQVGGRTIAIQQGAAGSSVQIGATPGATAQTPAADPAPAPTTAQQPQPAAPQAAVTPGSPAERVAGSPVRCEGADEVEVNSMIIEATGLAIEASGACRVLVRNSEIRSSGVAVGVSGGAQIEFIDSIVSGAGTAVEASGTSQVVAERTEFRGEIDTSGLARVVDRGGNRFD